ncbi:MAG: hypothetical protein U0002_01510 [Thermoanaerobaculia bacterium]
MAWTLLYNPFNQDVPQLAAKGSPAVKQEPAAGGSLDLLSHQLESAREENEARRVSARPEPPAAPVESAPSAMRERQSPEGELAGTLATGVGGGAPATSATSEPAAATAVPSTAQPTSALGSAALADERVLPARAEAPRSQLAPALSLQAEAAGITRFTNTTSSSRSVLGVAANTPSYEEARAAVARGRLPSPESIRIASFVNRFGPMGRGLAGGAPGIALVLEGAPTLAPGPGRRLLRVSLQAEPEGGAVVGSDVDVVVELNPRVVARWRLLADETRGAELRSNGQPGAARLTLAGGQTVTALFELELVPVANPGAQLASARLSYRLEPGGRRTEQALQLRLADLAPRWASASSELRLASLAAELARQLKQSEPGALLPPAEISRQAKQMVRELGGRVEVAEFAQLADQVAELLAQGAEAGRAGVRRPS